MVNKPNPYLMETLQNKLSYTPILMKSIHSKNFHNIRRFRANHLFRSYSPKEEQEVTESAATLRESSKKDVKPSVAYNYPFINEDKVNVNSAVYNQSDYSNTITLSCFSRPGT